MWCLEGWLQNQRITSYYSPNATEEKDDPEPKKEEPKKEEPEIQESFDWRNWKTDKSQYLLVIGYIRSTETKLSKGQLISIDIYQLCVNFYISSADFVNGAKMVVIVNQLIYCLMIIIVMLVISNHTNFV